MCLSCVKTENTEFLMQMLHFFYSYFFLFVAQQHMSGGYNEVAEPPNSFQEGYGDAHVFCSQIYSFFDKGA